MHGHSNIKSTYPHLLSKFSTIPCNRSVNDDVQNLRVFLKIGPGKAVLSLRVTVKVKQSRNRPGVAQRVPGGLGSQISWNSAHAGGEVVSLTHRPPLPPGMFLVLIFTRGWVAPRAMVRSEGNMSLKNPVTPPAIDPETVRLVAQRLNHYSTPGPLTLQV